MKDNSSTGSDGLQLDRLTPSRRVVIKSAAAIGLIGGLSSNVTGQEYAETFQLGGERSGWEGIAPGQIEGETNPTLQVVPGQQYQVAWENLDGAVHNFAILDEDGETVQASEFMSSQGEVQQVEFAAEENFAEYICEPHANTMRGDFELIEAEGEGETEAEAEDDEDEQTEAEAEGDGNGEAEAEAEEEEEPTEEPSAVIYLSLEEDGWLGLSPEQIEGELNPKLPLRAGETYAIAWTLRTERERHETGHNLVIHDEDGNHLTYTDFLTDEGTGRTLVFTASEEMAYYSDQTQLGVGGEIEVVGNGDGSNGNGGGEVSGNGNGGGEVSGNGNESDGGDE